MFKYGVQRRKIKVKDLEIEFDEKIKIDTSTGEDVYDRDLEIENTNKLYDIYRSRKNLCSVKEIIKIREMYGLSQTDFSLILGFGKITIHRYENGSLQDEAHDSIIKSVEDANVMFKYVEKNKNKISEESYLRLSLKIQELMSKKMDTDFSDMLKNVFIKNKDFTNKTFNNNKKIIFGF